MAEVSEASFTGQNSGLQIALNKGLVNANFYSRTDPETSANRACIQDLQVTNPRHDKSRIEGFKGGLLKEAYSWVLGHDDFKEWLFEEHCQLLWIKGDPGKGKTVLLCGIIDELTETIHDTSTIAFFFCQNTDARINNATAVIRGLISTLVEQRPSLIAHVRREYDKSGKQVFEDVNAWQALSNILMDMLKDPLLKSTYLIIDALDECETDLSRLLGLIAQHTSTTHVKWLISSRNRIDIEWGLQLEKSGAKLSLELKGNAEKVSLAVEAYIDHKISNLSALVEDEALGDRVRDQVRRKANGTFLWVALVFQELERAQSWDVLNVLDQIPEDLVALYDRMLGQTKQLQRNDPEYCWLVLSTAISVYRPLSLVELGALSDLPSQIANKAESIRNVVKMCGSFLTIREDHVYIVHQSAKDYLAEHVAAAISPSGFAGIHYSMFSRSLNIMFNILKRDIYGLGDSGVSIQHVKLPDEDPLVLARYPCIYWIAHLNGAHLNGKEWDDLQKGGQIHMFLQTKFLPWLEALSLLGCMSEGGFAIWELGTLLRESQDLQLHGLVQDAWRFIASHGRIIGAFPLQAYASALVFSPKANKIRKQFWKERIPFIKEIEVLGGHDLCLQNLEGHDGPGPVYTIAFTPDGRTVAASHVELRFWDVATGTRRQTIEGPRGLIYTFAFSPDGKTVASGSTEGIIWLSDTATGTHRSTLEGHTGRIFTVAFSPDGSTIISRSEDSTVRIWDAESGAHRQAIGGYRGRSSIGSVAFSPDGSTVTTCSLDNVLRIWDTKTGAQRQTLQGYRRKNLIKTVFSEDGKTAASSLNDCTVQLWDAVTGTCQQTIKGQCYDRLEAVARSPDGRSVALGFLDGTVWLWDAKRGIPRQWFKAESNIYSIVFSPDSRILASSCCGSTVRLWDAATDTGPHTLDGHDRSVITITISPDDKRAASGSLDHTVRLWDAAAGACLHTLRGHSNNVRTVAFSPDSKILASASSDRTVRLWDTATGVLLHQLNRCGNYIDLLVFSPDSRTLAAISDDTCTVQLWETATGACRRTLRGHKSGVRAFAFSADSKMAVSGSAIQSVRLWDATTGIHHRTLMGHIDGITAVAFSLCGQKVASGSRDSTVRLWNSATGTHQKTFMGHRDGITSVAFSPSGRTMASSSWDSTVRLWDMATGTQQQTLRTGASVVRSLSFSDDGRCLRTDYGFFVISTPTGSAHLTPQDTQSFRSALFIDEEWVLRDGKRILFLPKDYRPDRPGSQIVAGNLIVLGHQSGGVTFIHCDFDYS
ncbi:beta transducin-like protein HET-D2Y [Penicillium canescens]|uniref:Beta transducin-like protein HET-D2Y n=1 Tax=Penicillium canescens TaxID=5083 RepID=A0AAD6IIB5_PENCN|nr:beta transducin-like protein HET-D2Y [Penicillium canescens]KAJ6050043.1 beta transducin-like protein HET-D2Y [Penicillium canescens]KAJ6051082.1 beta transducin-like protein HET-D2Y [Penicillium canescens]KAJ6061595.1 beta transducin-like protein HET-D2Y [Penicillium canescens]